jgi:hypothetical protein
MLKGFLCKTANELPLWLRGCRKLGSDTELPRVPASVSVMRNSPRQFRDGDCHPDDPHTLMDRMRRQLPD